MLEWLASEPLIEVVGVVDIRRDAPGIQRAKELGIPVFFDLEEALRASAPCVAFNLTGNEMVEEIAASVLGAGAVVGGLEARLIWRIVTELRRAKQELEHMATHDALTQLPNRRFAEQAALQAIEQARRYREPLSLGIVDLDHFKKLNDTYGHAAGDAALVHAASTIRRALRRADLLARWGGEEFLVLFPKTPSSGARKALQKALEQLKNNPLSWHKQTIPLSFSAGISSLQDVGDAADAEQILDRMLALADEALYAAKRAGRGRVGGMPPSA